MVLDLCYIKRVSNDSEISFKMKKKLRNDMFRPRGQISHFLICSTDSKDCCDMKQAIFKARLIKVLTQNITLLRGHLSNTRLRKKVNKYVIVFIWIFIYCSVLLLNILLFMLIIIMISSSVILSVWISDHKKYVLHMKWWSL